MPYEIISNFTNGINKSIDELYLSKSGITGVVYQVVFPLVFAIIIILGILGNLMVIYVISARQKLRSTTNFLLLNLALADILFLVICGPVTITHYAYSEWTLGDAMCRTVQYFLYVTCYVTVYTLVAVAAVRYMLVVKRDLKAATFVNSGRNVVFVILLIWTVCLLVNIPVPMAYGFSIHEATNTTNTSSECVISVAVRGQRFFLLFFVFSYVIPLVTIATLYLLLVQHLHSNQARIKIGQYGSKGEAKSSHVTRVVVVVICVFAVCWLPLQVHLLWGTFGTLPDTLSYRVCLVVWHALVFVNSALNPLIYNLFSGEFRSAFKSVFSVLQRENSVNSGSTSRGALIK